MWLRKFFERVMGAACGPVRESDMIRVRLAASQDRRERPQKGHRAAERASPAGNTTKGRKANRRESRP